MARTTLQSRQVREVTYQLELVKCGKRNCKRCPHGPYWYAYFHNPRTGRTKSLYVGKKAPWEREPGKDLVEFGSMVPSLNRDENT